MRHQQRKAAHQDLVRDAVLALDWSAVARGWSRAFAPLVPCARILTFLCAAEMLSLAWMLSVLALPPSCAPALLNHEGLNLRISQHRHVLQLLPSNSPSWRLCALSDFPFLFNLVHGCSLQGRGNDGADQGNEDSGRGRCQLADWRALLSREARIGGDQDFGAGVKL